MNKTININLGGVPFTLDEEAYQHLDRYLKAIHHHFRHTEGYEEITSDIEARIAELFQDNLQNRPIITMAEVEEAIAIMGRPEEFGAEAMEEPDSGSGGTYRTGKRLFRNPEDEMIGGVCSGIAAYFGIPDPIWVRLLFVVLTISGAFGIPLYLILWAIMPKAQTAGDRLAMRGEPINASSIGRIIQEEVGHLSSEVGGEQTASDVRHAFDQAIRALGVVVRKVVAIIAAIWRPLLIGIAVLIMFVIAMGWIGTVIGLFTALPTLQVVLPGGSFMSMLLPINLLFLVGIPMAGLAMLAFRLGFGTRLPKAWRIGLAAIWGLNVASLFLVTSNAGRYVSADGEWTLEEVVHPAGNKLQLELRSVMPSDPLFDLDGEAFVEHGRISYYGVDFDIKPSKDNQWRMLIQSEARGKNEEDAARHARNVSWAPVWEDKGTLVIPDGIVLDQAHPMRMQQVDATLYVPAGGQLVMSQEVAEFVEDMELKDRSVDPTAHDGHTWTMTEEGLKCSACDGQDPSQKDGTETMSMSDL